jgi:predicted DNA-binding transcriptional regulator YafY
MSYFFSDQGYNTRGMNRLDRLFGILLWLRSGAPVAADALARRFEVSRRTIYRDIETLSALGVPVFARRGYRGGLQLLEGYFLPPLMLTAGEATSLLLGLTLLRSLRANPFAADLDTAEKKLLAAVPERLRTTLARANTLIGFETLSGDIFHPEPQAPPPPPDLPAEANERAVAGVFWQALLDHRSVGLDYHSLYRPAPKTYAVEPLGLFWDRERWYLAGRRLGQTGKPGLYRADRVLAARPGPPLPAQSSTATDNPPADFLLPTQLAAPEAKRRGGTEAGEDGSSNSPLPASARSAPGWGAGGDRSAFDIRTLLGRRWLADAMADWRKLDPLVRIRLAPAQAQRLRRDWYYGHAHFAPAPGGGEVMTFSEEDRTLVFELVRWLGPGAELIEPADWRPLLKAELASMSARY